MEFSYLFPEHCVSIMQTIALFLLAIYLQSRTQAFYDSNEDQFIMLQRLIPSSNVDNKEKSQESEVRIVIV